MIHSIYCRLYIASFCGFLCTYRKKTCSLCIGTFGANIIVIIDVVNFIVAVTVITKLICQHHMTFGDCLECVIRHVSCWEQATRGSLWQGNELLRKGWWDLFCFLLALTWCQDSYFWTLQECWCHSLLVAACRQRLNNSRGPSTRGP